VGAPRLPPSRVQPDGLRPVCTTSGKPPAEMAMLLHPFLKSRVTSGRLAVVYTGGRVENYGDDSGAPVAVRVSRRGERRILTSHLLGLGEAYMDGDLTFDMGGVDELLALGAVPAAG
jgi:hypothetical protein